MLSISIFIVVISLTACSEKSEHTHTLSKYQAIAATCNNDGNIDYWYCSGCEKYFSDEHAKNEITKEQTVKQKLGHSFTNYISNNDATCTTDGTKTAKCDRCDEKDTIIDIGSHGHKYINGICIVCGEGQEPATIQSVKGGKIDGMNISIFVEHSVDYVTLIDKITVGKSDIWDLCFDLFGNDKIDSKIAAQKNGKLNNGDNTFYILVKEKDGNAQNTYILTIYRSFSIEVNYYNGNELLKTDNVYTGYEYNSTFTPEIRGYTFNQWLDSENQTFTNAVLWNSIDLYADKTAKTFRVSFVTDSKAQPIESFMVVYDQQVTLPASSKIGYTFNGWLDGNKISENTFVWNFLEDKEYTAMFTINSYDVSFEQNFTAPGFIDNCSGLYEYDSDITIKAVDNGNIGYKWVGWYCENTQLTKELSYTVKVPAKNVTYTAKWEIVPEMANFNFNSTTTDCIITGIIDKTSTKIIVPYYVTSISKGAFGGCDNLKSITLPFVGEMKNARENNFFGYVFGAGSSESHSKYVPSSLETAVITGESNIGNNAFKFCDSLINIILSDGIKSIGEYSFSCCRSLVHIKIPDSVTSIGYGAFSECNSITDINIPEKISKFSPFLFNNCSKLTRIMIPEGVTSIGDYAFSGCSSLTHVKIPNGVTNICTSTFLKCSSLTSITIPEGLKSIGGYAFSGCSSLEEIKIPDDVTSIEEFTFSGCKNLTNITIPERVTLIGECAFSGCSSLTSITIPNGVKSIGNSAFSKCDNLTSIALPFLGATKDGVENTHFGFIFGAVSSNYNAQYVPQSLKEVIITGSTGIGEFAFLNCGSLVSVIMPDSVTSIGTCAFKLCHSLVNVKIPDGVISIERETFHSCFELINVTIPNSVTSIGDNAFWNCKSLTNIVIPKSVTTIGRNAFNLNTVDHSLKEIYYKGTAEDWEKISIGSYNDAITSAVRYYYSGTEPKSGSDETGYDGKYWHYINGEIIIWVKEN